MPDATPTPGRFHAVTADSLGSLVERLAADLAAAPLPPLEEELVVVQSQGMRRWLQLELARRHGCSASLRLPFPARFCRDVADLITPGAPAAPPLGGRFATGDDPFDRDVMTWRILGLLEDGLTEADPYAPLRRFCAGGARHRLGLAERIAGAFDDYLLYRPELLAAWEAGKALCPEHPHEAWQAELWRTISRGTGAEHTAVRLGRLVDDLATRAGLPAGLPSRVTVFGVSSLPPVFIDVLRGLARFIPVTSYLAAEPARGAHPLVQAWGGQARDLLDLFGGRGATWEALAPRRGAGDTVLASLQRGIVAGAAEGPIQVPPGDRSLQVHLCHSPLREMEVLRDQLLDALDADRTLRPHEILVMVPDVATYHPYIETVFGAGEGPAIPFHVADKPLAREFSLARHALDLLALVDGRRGAAEVLALLDTPAVRNAAGLSEGDVPLLNGWADATGIRWGTDGVDRHAMFRVPPVDANSWRAGLDRLLMGHAAGPVEQLVAGILPHGGDTAGSAALVGRFAHWAAGLFEALDALRAPRPLAEWRVALLDLLDRTVVAESDDEERALALVRGQLDTLAGLQARAGQQRAVPLDVVRDWLSSVLSDDSFGSGFLAGGITFAALKPMRAIPFKVVAMAGLDDASFPRHDRPRAFDLIAAYPRQGDRSLRADDRQLFLDSLLAAERRVILSCVGRSAISNAKRAPSVVIAELLDHLGSAAKQVTVEHRLQPFSPEYYRADAALFSYSAANAGACAVAGADPADPEAFVPKAAGDTNGAGPLVISLADLAECWANPSRFWCRRVLRLRLQEGAEAPEDHEPFEANALVRYGVKYDMVRRRARGTVDLSREGELLAARGDLPAAALAPAWHRRFAGEVDRFMSRVGSPVFLEPVSLDIRGDGWTLTGRVDGLVAGGRLQYRPATLKIKDQVRGWIGHLALAAHLGDPGLVSRVIGEDRSMAWRAPDDPGAVLAQLIAGYRAALHAPLPVFERASWEFARPRNGTRSPLEAAEYAFRLRWNFGSGREEGDAADPHVALCWRGRDPFDGDTEEFERWSSVLWEPAFAHETG